jgi:hypothetical protein
MIPRHTGIDADGLLRPRPIISAIARYAGRALTCGTSGRCWRMLMT